MVALFVLPAHRLSPRRRPGLHDHQPTACRPAPWSPEPWRSASRSRNTSFNKEKGNVDSLFLVTGQSFGGNGQNQAQAFIHLTDWSKRPGEANRAKAIAQRANAAFAKIRDAQAFVLVPPAVQSLGNSSGFDIELEDRAGMGHAALDRRARSARRPGR